jgi:hypothetical protein
VYTGYPLKAGHPLEGSCQEGKPPPYTPFCIFFAEVCRMAPRCRLVVSPAPVSSIVVMSLALWRRTRHPSGSRRMMDARLVARHPAPGTSRAPENPRYPAVSNRDKHNACGSPTGVHPEAGSRQGRRKNWTSRLEAICEGLRPGLISVAGYEPSRLEASRLNPHAVRRLIQTPWPRRKAPDDASCDNMLGLTCGPPSCGPPARWCGPASVGNSAVLSG